MLIKITIFPADTVKFTQPTGAVSKLYCWQNASYQERENHLNRFFLTGCRHIWKPKLSESHEEISCILVQFWPSTLIIHVVGGMALKTSITLSLLCSGWCSWCRTSQSPQNRSSGRHSLHIDRTFNKFSKIWITESSMHSDPATLDKGSSFYFDIIAPGGSVCFTMSWRLKGHLSNSCGFIIIKLLTRSKT